MDTLGCGGQLQVPVWSGAGCRHTCNGGAQGRKHGLGPTVGILVAAGALVVSVHYCSLGFATGHGSRGQRQKTGLGRGPWASVRALGVVTGLSCGCAVSLQVCTAVEGGDRCQVSGMKCTAGGARPEYMHGSGGSAAVIQ